MALFRKKKVGRPRNPLGNALFEYDNIINRDLSKIIDRIRRKRGLNPRRVDVILKDVYRKLDAITNSLSKENLKVDYRLDKIRYMIIDMINRLKSLFEIAGKEDFDLLKLEEYEADSELYNIEEAREIIKKKMNDIESDYK